MQSASLLSRIPLPQKSISMRDTLVPRSSHVAGVTLAALFCTTLSQYLSTRQSDLYSELLCWVAIPVLFKVQRRLQSSSPGDIRGQVKHDEPNYASAISLFSSHVWLKLNPMWSIALGVTISTVYKTDFLIVELYVSLYNQCLARGKTVCIGRKSNISG
jgi:hypothetical protein